MEDISGHKSKKMETPNDVRAFNTHKWEKVGTRRERCSECGHTIENRDFCKSDFPICPVTPL
jgi:hypothetical protein